MTKKFYRFWVYGRKEKLHKLTPEEIIHDLKSDITSCREWSISPEELVEIISKPGFPESKANEIKEIILDYHSLCNREGIAFGEEPNIFIATYCYHTITEKSGYCSKAKYRKSFLEKVTPWIEAQYQSVKDTDSGVFKDWEVDCLGNFHRYFGPDPVRWEYKIRNRFKKDFRIPKTATPETGN